jgi:hypothetical protein
MLGFSEEEKEQWFRAFETSKVSPKVAIALAKHASNKNCNHTLTDILFERRSHLAYGSKVWFRIRYSLPYNTQHPKPVLTSLFFGDCH